MKMSQEHQVLKCFSCETFQVHIVKKNPQWKCKLCGAKQSVKRNYGKGSGKDCRNQVMKLNQFRLSKEISSEKLLSEKDFTSETDGISTENEMSQGELNNDCLKNLFFEKPEKKANETVSGIKRVYKDFINGAFDEETNTGIRQSQEKCCKPSKYAKYLDDEK